MIARSVNLLLIGLFYVAFESILTTRWQAAALVVRQRPFKTPIRSSANQLSTRTSTCSCPRRRQWQLRLSPQEPSAGRTESTPAAAYLLSLLLLPLGSAAFPLLLDRITDLSAAAADRQTAIIALLVGKRFYLYATAAAALIIGASRAVEEPVNLGEVQQQ